MNRRQNLFLVFLLCGLALVVSACASPTRAASPAQPISACDSPACASLVVVQDGRPGLLSSSAPSMAPALAGGGERWKIDTGSPSPDGRWVAYTSIGNESGGPVLLQEMESVQWTNLIEAVNAHLPQGTPAFPLDYVWDVIGWFPDGKRLMIGPVDLSMALVVDTDSFSARSIVFPGGGRGGRMFVNLSPDGSRLLFIGDDGAGAQVMSEMDLATGGATELLRLPYQDGMLANPRYSPDASQVAYLLQTGQPDAGRGWDYSIYLLARATGQTTLLVERDLAMAVPTWSPDGQSIAFIRDEKPGSAPSLRDETPAPEHSNLWVVSLADGKQTQVTNGEGSVRSPVWSGDGRSLAFVSGDGQVGLVDLAQPGSYWQTGGPVTAPELTHTFFLP